MTHPPLVLPAHDEDAAPVLGSAASGLRFEPVFDIPAGGASFDEMREPFAVLSDVVGRYSKVLLARVVMGKDSTIQYLAWKMQRSDYYAAKATDLLTNLEIEARWEQEYRNLAQFRNTNEEVVTLSELGQNPDAAAPESEGVLISKPITFCKHTRRYFHPFCPECLSYLRDCKDEALLAHHGLPSYARSSARYLYCPECSAKASGREATFYSYALTPEELPGSRARVVRRSAMFREWRRVLSANEERKLAPEREKRATQIFPCFTCAQREACYNDKEKTGGMPAVEELLYPVSFYEFRALPLQLLHVHYDDFCDLLGGADWDDFKRDFRNRGVSSGQAFVMSKLVEPVLSATHQFIYEEDRSGLLPIEILRLKMIAFTQLCHGVRALHRRCRRPHLDLTPASVMANIIPTGRDLPARWSFQIKIFDLAATAPFVPLPEFAETFAGIFVPPHNYNQLYTSPTIKDTPFGLWEHLHVTIRETATREENETQRVEIEIDLFSDQMRMAEISAHDLLRVVLNAPAHGLGHLEVWGRKTGEMPRGVRMRGVLATPDPQTLAALAKIANQSFPNGRVAHYKTYFTPCDVHSLGMLLLRTLLVNDKNDLSRVAKIVERVVQRLTLDLKPEGEVPDHRVIERLQPLLRENEEFFSKNALLYKHEHRERRRNAVPEELWQDILIFAFRLLTHVPGFSICAHHGDYDWDKPEANLERVLQFVQNINHAIHAEIFGSQERNREIWEVCDEVLNKFPF